MPAEIGMISIWKRVDGGDAGVVIIVVLVVMMVSNIEILSEYKDVGKG
jgi:hypothetical protein